MLMDMDLPLPTSRDNRVCHTQVIPTSRWSLTSKVQICMTIKLLQIAPRHTTVWWSRVRDMLIVPRGIKL